MPQSHTFMPPIPQEVLSKLTDTTLFYPHSGQDFALPIRLFAPVIADFWFADLAYFGPADPADSAKPVLQNGATYELESVEVQGPPVAEMEYRVPDGESDRGYQFLLPCIRTEQYRHLDSGRVFRIHRRRGFSTCAFHKLKSIGVFFYRRDSSEGSSVAWLSAPNWGPRKRQRWLVHQVIDKIIDGGLVLTDGSRCEGMFNPYIGFTQYFVNREIGPEAASLAKPFVDDENRRFQCVGYAGQGNGPVLVWQIDRSHELRRM